MGFFYGIPSRSFHGCLQKEKVHFPRPGAALPSAAPWFPGTSLLLATGNHPQGSLGAGLWGDASAPPHQWTGPGPGVVPSGSLLGIHVTPRMCLSSLGLKLSGRTWFLVTSEDCVSEGLLGFLPVCPILLIWGFPPPLSDRSLLFTPKTSSWLVNPPYCFLVFCIADFCSSFYCLLLSVFFFNFLFVLGHQI